MNDQEYVYFLWVEWVNLYNKWMKWIEDWMDIFWYQKLKED